MISASADFQRDGVRMTLSRVVRWRSEAAWRTPGATARFACGAAAAVQLFRVTARRYFMSVALLLRPGGAVGARLMAQLEPSVLGFLLDCHVRRRHFIGNPNSAAWPSKSSFERTSTVQGAKRPSRASGENHYRGNAVAQRHVPARLVPFEFRHTVSACRALTPGTPESPWLAASPK